MACCAVAAFVVMRIITFHKSITGHSIFSASSRLPGKSPSSFLKPEEQGTACRLKVSITCASCISSIEGALSSVPGIYSMSASLLSGNILVSYNAKFTAVETIISTIEDAGFDVEEVPTAPDPILSIKAADKSREQEVDRWRKAFVSCIIFTVPTVVLANASQLVGDSARLYSTLLQAILCGIVVLGQGKHIHLESKKALSENRLDLSILTSLGMILAYARSIQQIISGQDILLFDSTSTLMTVIMGGRFLKALIFQKSFAALSTLAKSMPATAQVALEDGKITIVPVNMVKAGDTLFIPQGDIIPADGEVMKGSSQVSETNVTGEVLPVWKSEGSEILAGSTLLDGQLLVQASAVGHETRLERALQLLDGMDTQKRQTPRLEDLLIRWFLLGTFTIAVCTGLFSYATGVGLSRSLDRIMSVILCACPCALGLGTPLAVMTATRIAAKHGIFVKGSSEVFEAGASIKAVIFDKTGTLTTGSLRIQSVKVTPEWRDAAKRAMWWNAVLRAEEQSEHPVGRAIKYEACRRLADMEEHCQFSTHLVEEVKVSRGSGVQCNVVFQDNANLDTRCLAVQIGSRAFFERTGMAVNETDASKPPGSGVENVTEVYVAVNGVYAGRIVASDELRADAAETIAKLKIAGYEVGMITGSATGEAHRVAEMVRIPKDWVWSEMLPTQKLNHVKRLQRRIGPIAMVGDGLNDFESMAASDFSIAAFAEEGSAVGQSCNALLLQNPKSASDAEDELTKINDLLALSKAVTRKMRQNLYSNIAYNTCALVLSTGVLENWGLSTTPFYASLGMSLSSTFVVLNTLRLEQTVKFKTNRHP